MQMHPVIHIHLTITSMHEADPARDQPGTYHYRYLSLLLQLLSK